MKVISGIIVIVFNCMRRAISYIFTKYYRLLPSVDLQASQSSVKISRNGMGSWLMMAINRNTKFELKCVTNDFKVRERKK